MIHGMYDMQEYEKIQYNYHYQEGTRMNPDWWAQGLILKIIEATHGQWIYRNIQIHDAVTGTQVTLWKEAIQHEIKEKMELGEAGLLEEDQWMMEVNLGNLEITSGENEEYWLLAIKAAWVAATLTGWWGQSALQTTVGDRHFFLNSIQTPLWSGLEGFK
jgi:hypothetical protein